MTSFYTTLVECLQSRDTSGFYFPVGTLEPSHSGFDRFLQCWFAQALRAMGEPRLAGTAAPADRDAYRFLWMRSFDRPVAVRAERRRRRLTLTARMLAGRAGYDHGALALTRRRWLTEEDWDELDRLIEAARFWSLPAVSEREGLDGATWVLEGARAGRHHVVHRWSPEVDGDDAGLRATCVYLLGLSELGAAAGRTY
ncbi:MAG TPA: hypothetical protein VNA89_09140 [Gemmatimonadaceae bacterium]|nr:hypothetical protein [Gemmatimonadaceae bacterium]